jgi:hypothetical protein
MKNKKAITILTIFFCFALSAFSQIETIKTRNNQIGICGGYNQGFIKDPIFSNLNYTENGYLADLLYSHLTPNRNNLIKANVNFSSGKLKTNNIDFFTSSYILANINLAYLRKLPNHKSQYFSSYLGVNYMTRIQYLDWNNQTSFSFIATHGLSIQTNLFWNIKTKHSIETALSIPVFQVLVRPPYNGIDNFITDNQDNTIKLIFTGKPTSLNKYVAINWETNYKYAISDQFDLKLGYTLNYERIFETQEFIQLQNQIMTGINIKF